jgi:DNA-binding PadR family transcriptional regulator
LTELEGEILVQIYHRGEQTAFQVRRSFATSPSLESRGSASAVYPAIRRLEKAGLIRGTATSDGRGSHLLCVTALGRDSMLEWAGNEARACGYGIDPFRARAGVWLGLDPKVVRDLLERMRDEIQGSIRFLEGFSRRNDTIERVSVDLSLRLQKTRLEWLDEVSALWAEKQD